MSILPPNTTVLQVIPELETGGAEQTTLDIAQAVARDGGRALVASRGGRMARELAKVGGELVLMPAQSKNPLTVTANAVRLAALIRRHKVSLIHVRSRAPAFSALWAARLCGIPFIATYHGVYNAKGRLKRWYNAIMTKGELVIANSNYTRAHVIAEHGIAPERVIAIPRGIRLERFDPAAVSEGRIEALRRKWGLEGEEDRTIILAAGRLTRWKGQALLVEAATRLAEAGRTNFVIILAGDDQGRDSYRGELEEAIDFAGLHDHVRIVGHVEDMPAAYLLAELALAPSLDPEAFGRTAVEPQLMGRPVIAADQGAARETVVDGETGWLAVPGDPAAWTTAIEAALALSPEKRAAMGSKAAERARRLYSVDAMTESTLRLYARLLRAHA
ncbi:MAG: glycosyl transferase [Caulobacteraceae bacterium]|nr:glycosyl transferase [Caulobacteraceae bacterium]